MATKRLLIVSSCRTGMNSGFPQDIASGLIASASVKRVHVEFCSASQVRKHKPDRDTLAAVSGAYTQFINTAYHATRTARRFGAATIVGGQHVSALSEEALKHCDSVVQGEAESVWDSVLDDFLTKGKLQQLYKGTSAPDILPEYFVEYMIENAATVRFIEAVRGCSNACEFCSVHGFFGTPRFADIARMDTLLKAVGPGRFIRFTAPDIFINQDYFRELCSLCRNHGIRWKAYANIAIANHDWALKAAHESGCVKLEIGFEDFDRSNTRKLSSVNDDFVKAARCIRSAGIQLIGYCIIGGDNLSLKDYSRHFRFVLSRTCNACTTFMLTPFPGSRLYEKLRREKRILRKPWHRYNRLWVVFKPRLPRIVLYILFIVLNIFGELLPSREFAELQNIGTPEQRKKI